MITFIFGLVLLGAGLYQAREIAGNQAESRGDTASFAIILLGSLLVAIIGLVIMWANLPGVADFVTRLMSAPLIVRVRLLLGLLLLPCTIPMAVTGVEYLNVDERGGIHGWLPLAFALVFLDLGIWLVIMNIWELYA